jgi:biotin synthase
MNELRHNWALEEIEALYGLALPELLYRAQSAHRRYFPVDDVQLSTLLNVKTGGCPEDCAYCPQSARYETDVDAVRLLDVDTVAAAARRAKQAGASRFCMGAAWRSPRDRDLDKVAEMVAAVHDLGLETCVTLGMLNADQARRLKAAGLDYYNHNLDTSPEHYPNIISTRIYQDRIDTIGHVRDAGLKVCCGGIVGMGESRRDRCRLLQELSTLPEHPQSVPINVLVRVPGTPLEDAAELPPLEVVRTIATARVLMPASRVRLSAGRAEMSTELQALCFVAGANSVFYGEQLLTTPNPESDQDRLLLDELGLRPSPLPEAEIDSR